MTRAIILAALFLVALFVAAVALRRDEPVDGGWRDLERVDSV